MPELPDVELFKRLLEECCLHRRIRATSVRDPGVLREVSARKLQRRLKGHHFERARRHGKFLFVDIDRPCEWLVMHFGMTGDLQCAGPTEAPQYTRLGIAFENGKGLFYRSRRRLGMVGLTSDPEDYIQTRGLGPDALDPALDFFQFQRLFSRCRGTIKAALMDQKRIAGLGNIYSDELLFQAAINPKCLVRHLEGHRLEVLFKRLPVVLRQAVEASAYPERLPADCLLLYRVRGGHCPRCGEQLRWERIGGRTSFYCLTCQPRDPTP